MTTKRTYGLKKDFTLPILVTVCALFGCLAITIALADPFTGSEQSFADTIERLHLDYAALHLLWFALGCGVVFGMMFFDYEVYGKLHMVIYWFMVSVLALVLVFGTIRGGTRGWFIFGERGLQPSELAKLGIIVFMARRLSRFEEGPQTFRELLPTLIYFLIPFGLILAQKDFGTSMVFVVIFFGMLFMSGTNWKIVLVLAGVMVGVFAVAWLYILPTYFPYAYNRILVFLDPGLDPTGAGYHAEQSKIAVGSGGFAGKGAFGEGVMSQLRYLPARYTDFIFSVICESLGFIGAMILLVLYALMIVRMIYISFNAYDRFGAVMVMGVVCMMFAHIFENVGMCIGVMPITGIPLPFVSYGGSSMLTNMMAIGIVMNVSWRRNKGVKGIAMVQYEPDLGPDTDEKRIERSFGRSLDKNALDDKRAGKKRGRRMEQ